MRRAVLALIASLATLGLTAGPSAATAPSGSAAVYTFDISVETPCVAGHGPGGKPVTVPVRSAAGHELGAHAVTADGAGHWKACFDGLIVEPGMTVTARHAAARRRVTVPGLTLRTDRPTDVLSGRGPAGKSLNLTLTRCVFSDPCRVKHYVVTPDSHGHYRDDVSAANYPWDLEGGDKAVIEFQTAAGDLFHADSVTELMRVQYPNRAILQIYPPGSSVTVSLLSSTGSVRAEETRTAATSGAYTFRFVRGGHAVTIQPGNVIRANFASDARMVWPHVGLVGNTATNHVSGTCLKNVPLEVTVNPPSSVNQEGMTGSDGRFDLDFTSDGGIHSGNTLLLVCRADTGDRLEFRAAVP